MIIYPPYIDDIIPAFTSSTLVVPFTQNPGVAKDQYDQCEIKYWEYGVTSANVRPKLVRSYQIKYDENTKIGKAYFRKSDGLSLSTNKYYKIQIGYVDKNDADATVSYSNVAIGRCITAPSYSIIGLDTSRINRHFSNYVLNYEAATISSEPIYSYQLKIQQKSDKKLIETTGEVIYNSDNDIITTNTNNTLVRKAQIDFYPTVMLKPGIVYQLIVSITTINGYTSTKTYEIVEGGGFEPVYNVSITANQDFIARENGYVNITVTDKTDGSTTGRFILERSSDNEVTWNELTKFDLPFSTGKSYTWIDKTCEAGVVYSYAIRQYATTSQKNSQDIITYYSERITSTDNSHKVLVNFEYFYLSDQDRQLKIMFNPQVSSFKTNILETKMDAIGNKYPYFFRNGIVNYKEIPISGLISYLMDEQCLFMTKDELGVSGNNYQSINLSYENVALERKFKLGVLDWLTNGKPKLFRSAEEGSYVLRLMNVSLSPQTQLGRMLHTFSATGYECASTSFDQLKNNNLISLEEKMTQDYNTSKDGFIQFLNNSYENVEVFGAGVQVSFTKIPEKIYLIVVENKGKTDQSFELVKNSTATTITCKAGKTLIYSDLPPNSTITKKDFKANTDTLSITTHIRINDSAASSNLGNFVLDNPNSVLSEEE